MPHTPYLPIFIEAARIADAYAPAISQNEWKSFLAIAKNEPTDAAEIMRIWGFTQSTMSRITTRLGPGTPRNPGYGLIRQEVDPENRRRMILRISELGRELLIRFARLHVTENCEAAEDRTEEEHSEAAA